MKRITVKEEFQVPGTEIILEKGDQLSIASELKEARLDSSSYSVEEAAAIMSEMGEILGERYSDFLEALENVLSALADAVEANPNPLPPVVKNKLSQAIRSAGPAFDKFISSSISIDSSLYQIETYLKK